MSADLFPLHASEPARAVPARPGPGRPVLSLSLSCDGSTKVITVRGEIDTSNAHLLVELVEFVCRPPLPPIALDLSSVNRLGEPGISALRRVWELVSAAGGRLTVRSAPDDGRDCSTKRPLWTVPGEGPG